jgi:leucine dehydrogenase
LGVDSLKGLRVAVQGIGKVGYDLCRQLNEAGASLVVSDVNESSLKRAQAEFGAIVVPTDQILYQDVDILSPCALGAVLNAESIPNIKASIIGGAANNQLATETDGLHLFERGILYAPDYVINGGGIISVSLEYMGDKTADDTHAQIALIPDRLTDIFVRSDEQRVATNVVADTIAESIVAKGAARKNSAS